MRMAELTLEQAVAHKHLIETSQTFLSFKVCPSSQAGKCFITLPYLICSKLHNPTIPISQNTVNLFYEAFYQSIVKS